MKAHHTKDYYQLKKEMERLIHEGHLKNYVKGELLVDHISSAPVGEMT